MLLLVAGSLPLASKVLTGTASQLAGIPLSFPACRRAT